MTDIPVSTTDTVEGDTSFFGHPKGLLILFLTEMWERFSYYGMRGLLIIYLTQHFLFSDEKSALIYGAYTALVYVMTIIGGTLAILVWRLRAPARNRSPRSTALNTN